TAPSGPFSLEKSHEGTTASLPQSTLPVEAIGAGRERASCVLRPRLSCELLPLALHGLRGADAAQNGLPALQKRSQGLRSRISPFSACFRAAATHTRPAGRFCK